MSSKWMWVTVTYIFLFSEFAYYFKGSFNVCDAMIDFMINVCHIDLYFMGHLFRFHVIYWSPVPLFYAYLKFYWQSTIQAVLWQHLFDSVCSLNATEQYWKIIAESTIWLQFTSGLMFSKHWWKIWVFKIATDCISSWSLLIFLLCPSYNAIIDRYF